jgi:hypothetical protein
MTKDGVDFVRQGAFIALGMILSHVCSALKTVHVGFSMGIAGTKVAKELSDIILIMVWRSPCIRYEVQFNHRKSVASVQYAF